MNAESLTKALGGGEPGEDTFQKHGDVRHPINVVAAVANLHAEFHLAYRNRTRQHDEHLARAGISAKTTSDAGGLGVQRISTAGRLFQPSLGGFPAIIIAIREIGLVPDTLDLLAIRIDAPDRWWARLGELGLILGEDRYLAAVSRGDAVRVFDSPVAWLQGNCDGCVFLDDVEARWEMERQSEDSAALREWWEDAA